MIITSSSQHTNKSSQVQSNETPPQSVSECPMSDTSTMSQSHYSQSPGPPSLCPRPSLMVVSSPVLRTQPPDRRNSQVPMHDQHAPRACTAPTTLPPLCQVPYDTPSFSRHVEHAGQGSRTATKEA